MDINIIYLIRHGVTEFNIINRVQGDTDSPLTPEGEKYAFDVGRIIPNEKNYRNFQIISSPLFRAIQTANIIGNIINVKPNYDERLVELRRGMIEGKTENEFTKEDVKHVELFNIDPWKYRIPGGENYFDLFTRCDNFINETVAKQKKLIIVSHGYTIRMLLLIFEKCKKEQYTELKVPHNLIYRIEFLNELIQKNEIIKV